MTAPSNYFGILLRMLFVFQLLTIQRCLQNCIASEVPKRVALQSGTCQLTILFKKLASYLPAIDFWIKNTSLWMQYSKAESRKANFQKTNLAYFSLLENNGALWRNNPTFKAHILLSWNKALVNNRCSHSLEQPSLSFHVKSKVKSKLIVLSKLDMQTTYGAVCFQIILFY